MHEETKRAGAAEQRAIHAEERLAVAKKQYAKVLSSEFS